MNKTEISVILFLSFISLSVSVYLAKDLLLPTFSSEMNISKKFPNPLEKEHEVPAAKSTFLSTILSRKSSSVLPSITPSPTPSTAQEFMRELHQLNTNSDQSQIQAVQTQIDSL